MQQVDRKYEIGLKGISPIDSIEPLFIIVVWATLITAAREGAYTVIRRALEKRKKHSQLSRSGRSNKV